MPLHHAILVEGRLGPRHGFLSIVPDNLRKTPGCVDTSVVPLTWAVAGSVMHFRQLSAHKRVRPCWSMQTLPHRTRKHSGVPDEYLMTDDKAPLSACLIDETVSAHGSKAAATSDVLSSWA